MMAVSRLVLFTILLPDLSFGQNCISIDFQSTDCQTSLIQSINLFRCQHADYDEFSGHSYKMEWSDDLAATVQTAVSSGEFNFETDNAFPGTDLRNIVRAMDENTVIDDISIDVDFGDSNVNAGESDRTQPNGEGSSPPTAAPGGPGRARRQSVLLESQYETENLVYLVSRGGKGNMEDIVRDWYSTNVYCDVGILNGHGCRNDTDSNSVFGYAEPFARLVWRGWTHIGCHRANNVDYCYLSGYPNVTANDFADCEWDVPGTDGNYSACVDCQLGFVDECARDNEVNSSLLGRNNLTEGTCREHVQLNLTETVSVEGSGEPPLSDEIIVLIVIFSLLLFCLIVAAVIHRRRLLNNCRQYRPHHSVLKGEVKALKLAEAEITTHKMMHEAMRKSMEGNAISHIMSKPTFNPSLGIHNGDVIAVTSVGFNREGSVRKAAHEHDDQHIRQRKPPALSKVEESPPTAPTPDPTTTSNATFVKLQGTEHLGEYHM